MSQIIVTGWSDYANEDERDFVLRALVVLAGESRKEPGCLAYVMSPDPENVNRINIYERWDSNASLMEHLTLPHVAAFRDALGGIVKTAGETFKYDADNQRSVHEKN